MIQTLFPRGGAKLLLLAMRNVRMRAAGDVPGHEFHVETSLKNLGNRNESLVHAAADAHVAKMSVAVRYAFALGRKAYKAGGTKAATKAIRAALLDVLPSALLKVVDAGGKAGMTILEKQLRAASHKYGSTQVNLPPDLATKVIEFGKMIPDDDLAADGREMTPHVTVKYGLIGVQPEDLTAALASENPASITLGRTGTFAGVEGGTADAVTIAVTSEDLHRLNKKIVDVIETVSTQAFYQPHVTVAYVKPGLGLKYTGNTTFEGIHATFDRIMLSSKDDDVVEIPLGLRTAGDNEGHPFHGNQYTEGQSDKIVPGEIGIGGVKIPDSDEKLTDEVIDKLFKTARLPDEARTPEGAEHLFYQKFREANPTLYHESPGDVSESIKKHGLTGGEYGDANFAAIGVSSEYVNAETKTIVTFKALDPSNVTPDISYAWSNKLSAHQVLLLQFPKLTGAYIAVSENIPARKLLSVTVKRSKTLEGELRAAKNPPVAKFKMEFNVSNPDAVAWAEEHAAELAKNLSETSEQAIKDAIAAALEGDGIAEHQDEILDAVGDEDRADLIARHETMTAANEGQRQAWGQAVEGGLLPETAQRVWIVTDDERLCPICADLDGEVTDLDGEYPGDGGNGPPAHVQCRCTEGIV